MNTDPHYTTILKAHLNARKCANPHYSLRAFARDLGLSPAKLSLLLSRKQGLSSELAQSIAKRLALSPVECDRFCTLVQLLDARSKAARARAHEHLVQQQAQWKLQTIEDETFRIMADWQHFAILEAILLKDYPCTQRIQKPQTPLTQRQCQWLSQRLDLAHSVIEDSLGRLLQQGLLRLDPKKGYTSTGAQLVVGGERQSKAVRQYTAQLLDKARASVECQTFEERYLGTLTVAIRSQDLPQIKNKLREIREQFNEYIQNLTPVGHANEVYTLAFPFFRLTQKESQSSKQKEHI